MRFTLELPSPASVVHDGDLDLLSSHVRDSPRGYFSSLVYSKRVNNYI